MIQVEKESKTCPACGDTFVLKRDWQKFCSKDCREWKHQVERKLALTAWRKAQSSEGGKVMSC